jgi:outer membrane protein OmpA-like peptidoglycan-associated protein
MKQIVLLTVSVLLSLHCFAIGDTLGVYFRFNETSLPDEMLKRLDSALIKGPLNRNGRLLIIGHTDALGSDGYNLQLSRRRASSVKEFLIGTGIRPTDIQLITGLGELNAGDAENADSRPQDRRVDVVLLPANAADVQRETRMKAVVPVAAPVSHATHADSAKRLTRQQLVRKADSAVTRFRPAAAPASPGARRDSAKRLQELAAGESLVLRNIFFYPGRHEVRPESYPTLDTLLRALLDQPTLVIRVEGHVCCIPAIAPDAMDEETYRLELSANRAEVIRQMLIEQGVEPKRIQAAGFGRRFPISQTEQNEDEANLNRRVEVRIISK